MGRQLCVLDRQARTAPAASQIPGLTGDLCDDPRAGDLRPEGVEAATMTTAATQCTQPDCGGTLDGGYCTVCGMAPASAPSVAASQERGSPATPAATAGIGGTLGTRASRASRGNLGAGLVDVPPIQAHDPATEVLVDPQV